MKAGKISRQQFLKVAGLGAGSLGLAPLLAACATGTGPTPASTTPLSSIQAAASPATVTPDKAATSAPQKVNRIFPAGFLWGAATSAYQIEGAVSEDGRGESIWDRFCSTGRCKGDTGAVAADHYHRWESDLDLMQTLGLQTYRFSIAWPRIMPQGTGAVNQKGLDFYKRLVEGLNKRNITPMATLYHWDLPQALEDKGGWTNRDTAGYFARYSEEVFRALGSQVPLWTTINEPWVTANLGYGSGVYAPGQRGIMNTLKSAHYQLLGHGLSVQSFRSLALKNTQIGIVLNTAPVYPATGSEADKTAALVQDGTRNRLYLDPLLKGSYPADLLERWKNQAVTFDFMQPGDLTITSQPLDFLGINYYSPVYVKAGSFGSIQEVPGPHPHAQLDWEQIYPDALHEHLVRLKKDYGNPAIYITECGAAYLDKLDSNGQVNDADRLKYLHDHFIAAHQALADGVDLKGFYVWSFLDNFEWVEGYSARFGIVYVDYQTQKRYPKRSALWYSQLIKSNSLEG